MIPSDMLWLIALIAFVFYLLLIWIKRIHVKSEPHWASVALTAGLIIVTLIYAASTAQIAESATKDTNVLAEELRILKEDFEITNRPYIAVETIEIESIDLNGHIYEPGEKIDENSITTINFYPQFKNFGNLAGKVIESEFRIKEVDEAIENKKSEKNINSELYPIILSCPVSDVPGIHTIEHNWVIYPKITITYSNPFSIKCEKPRCKNLFENLIKNYSKEITLTIDIKYTSFGENPNEYFSSSIYKCGILEKTKGLRSELYCKGIFSDGD